MKSDASTTATVGNACEDTSLLALFPRYAGAAVASFGLLMIVSWYAHWRPILQMELHTAPIKYNTALCFVLAGGGLFLLTTPRARWAPFLGLAAAFLALVTLLEYVTGRDLYVDQLFLKPYFEEATEYTGRMSPLSTICFVLIGASILLVSLKKQWPHRLTAAGMLACIVCVVMLVALAGFIFGIEAATGWGAYSRIAINTSAAFLVLSLGLLVWAWQTARRENYDFLRWLPVSASVTLMVMIACIAGGNAVELNKATFWRQHTFQVILNAHAFEETLSDIQRGARGYVTMGDPNALASYQNSTNLEPQAFNQLVEMTSDNRAQQQRLKDLAAAMEDVLSYDRGVIVLYRQKGFEAVSKLDTQGGSRMIVGRARDVLKAFTQDEQKLLQERDAREQADTHNAARLFIFGSALAASLLIFASWMTSREMSRRQRVEWERERALKDAENARHAALAATEAKSNFLSNMSHEIRTPLNGMVGAAEVLGETPLSAEQREYLGILTSECEGLRRLVNDILDLSKLEADRVKFEETEFEVRELIKKVCQNLRPHADGKGLALIDEVAPDVEGFRIGDPYRIRQILLNLVSNAIKFTASGSVTARVTNGPDDRVRFSVVDTGIGIPPEQQRELFGRFAQANVSVTRQYGGSGLGLSIVKSLVERMQGRVELASEPGKGSTFSFELPLKRAAGPSSTGVENRAELAPEKSPRTSSSSIRLLLVDDYAINRRIFTRFLEQAQFKVETAENGKLGLERFKSSHYDIVVMDMHMPEMDGWTATREIRKWEAEHSRAPSTPIIALTASALQEDVTRCLEAGCTAFLGKPIYKKELLAELGRVLNVDISARPADQPAKRSKADLDPEIAELVPQFLQEMLQKSASISQAAENGDFQAAMDQAHQVIGPGGSFGFPEISNMGRVLEGAAGRKDQAELKRLAQEFNLYMNQVKVIYE